MDSVICAEVELLMVGVCVVELDSEETCVFVFAVVGLGLVVTEGEFEIMELELITLVVEIDTV